jgi:phosphoglycolate phosphatase-like HAD superfamily hydrolase
MVISNTPLDALQRDWQENNIVSNILYIGGQETGSKTEMLMAAANGKYRSDHILIIGDSPGDLTAAQNINALFFPILPTKEEYSWESFLSEGARRFLANRYNVSYQKEQIEGFESVINTVPSWNK